MTSNNVAPSIPEVSGAFLINKPSGYYKITLKELMKNFPGTYIHVVCRGSIIKNSTTGEILGSKNSLKDEDVFKHTLEEVSTKKVPLMSHEQKEQGVHNIIESKQAATVSRFNKGRGRKENNILLAGLRKSLVQNQLKASIETFPNSSQNHVKSRLLETINENEDEYPEHTGHPIRAMNHSNVPDHNTLHDPKSLAPNIVVHGQNENPEKKSPTVLNGGRTRRKLYKSKTRKNNR